MVYGPSLRAAMIAGHYSRYLGRFPDTKGFQLLLGSNLDEAGIVGIIEGSDECLELNRCEQAIKAKLAQYPGKKKILLFGAYGNGNLGDIEMANVIARELEQKHDVVCFAHSLLAEKDYVFAEDRKIAAPMRALNPRILSLFDGLVIGGGGVLEWPHDPMWDPAWAYLIPIPYVILAVGAGHPLNERVHNLVSRALVASGRDQASVAGLARVNTKAEFCPDPILSLVTPALLLKKENKNTRLFVVRGAHTAWHDKVKASLREGDKIVLFEAKNDAELSAMFPDAILVQSIAAYMALVAKADLVIAERYHGAILSLLCGKPTVGIYRGDHNASKIVNLFSALGIPEFCTPDLLVPDAGNDFPLELVASRIQSLKTVFQHNCTSIIERLLNPTAAAATTLSHFA